MGNWTYKEHHISEHYTIILATNIGWFTGSFTQKWLTLSNKYKADLLNPKVCPVLLSDLSYNFALLQFSCSLNFITLL